jgi:REP element-mobilizing transposase RayT
LWDYRWAGIYFVTICTWQRDCLFDNPALKSVVEDSWIAIPDHFPHCATDEYVVMPNHLHGL